MVKLANTRTKIVYRAMPQRRPGTTFKRIPKNELEKPDDAPGMINGIPAKSAWEWNIARALWTLGWDFEYQVSVMGGQGMPGGKILDFLVRTVPAATPLPVNGDYWHSKKDNEYENTQMEDALRSYGYMIRPSVVATDKDAATYEDALRFCTLNFGRS